MKQKDWILIIVVAFFAGVVSLLVSNMLLTPPEGRKMEVEVVGPIEADFSDPDKKYFNAKSVNLTQIIRIEESKNEDPFRKLSE